MKKKTELTVLRNDVEWSTRFDGNISGVEINGRKINDVHDLTQKVIKQTKTIRYLAWIATGLAVMAVGTLMTLTSWLLSHEASIEQLLLTGNKEYNAMADGNRKWRSHQRHRAWIHLKEFHGLHWDEGMQDWVNHAMVGYNKKGN